MDCSCIHAKWHHHRFKIVYIVSMPLVEMQCEHMTGVQWGLHIVSQHHEKQAVVVIASNSPVVHQKNGPPQKKYH